MWGSAGCHRGGTGLCKAVQGGGKGRYRAGRGGKYNAALSDDRAESRPGPARQMLHHCAGSGALWY